MKAIYLICCTILIVLLSFTTINGQTDYSARLKKEIVKIEAGKYVSNEFQFAKFSNGNSLQIKVSATCPVDIMNRDNFISIYSSVSTMMLLATFSQSGIEMPDIKELDELIGDPDITYNLVMAKNGMQIQTITGEGKENVTMKWEELFE
jgi:hypothetical protein